jgi:hypothetical protein
MQRTNPREKKKGSHMLSEKEVHMYAVFMEACLTRPADDCYTRNEGTQ